MRGLEGKVALVAGAAPGNIGAATAIRLAQEGTSVVAADLNEAAARAVADDIQASGGKAIARSFDITDEASYKELVDDTVKEFGRLDGLFNVAADLSPATLSQDTDVLSVSLDVWRHTIDVTLSGYTYGIRHTATLGGKHGVRCNSVAPGLILTAAALANTTEEYRNEMLASVRSNRLGVPEDLAAMVAFLFSDDGAYVTGQTIVVDGGANFTWAWAGALRGQCSEHRGTRLRTARVSMKGYGAVFTHPAFL
jgi:NAD(P)-dependent dehydrogenase (short-subunit alcohol dehydrogenase family)